jgi:hypothetical protein
MARDETAGCCREPRRLPAGNESRSWLLSLPAHRPAHWPPHPDGAYQVVVRVVLSLPAGRQARPPPAVRTMLNAGTIPQQIPGHHFGA